MERGHVSQSEVMAPIGAFTLISVKYWYVGLRVLALSPWTEIMSTEYSTSKALASVFSRMFRGMDQDYDSQSKVIAQLRFVIRNRFLFLTSFDVEELPTTTPLVDFWQR